MARTGLKFQPPQGVDTTSPNEAFNKGLGNTISNLPLLYAQTRAQMMEQQIKEKALKAQLDQNQFTQGIETKKVGIAEQDSATKKYEAENKVQGVLYYSPSKKQTFLTQAEAPDSIPVDSKAAALHHAMTTPGAIIKTNPDGTMEISYTAPGQKNTVISPPKVDPDEKKAAKSGVSGELQKLRDYYKELQDAGAIVDTSKGFLSNAARKAQSSGVGQFLGGVAGTENQSIRQKIKNMRPLLINEIRKATGMSAKAMDSNQELKFYLSAVTDPSTDIQSNLAAIEALEQRYGTGAVLSGPEVGTVEDGYKFKGGDASDPNNWEKVNG